MDIEARRRRRRRRPTRQRKRRPRRRTRKRRRRRPRKRWTQQTTRKMERKQRRRTQSERERHSLHRLLRVPKDKPIPFKKALSRYRSLKRKVKKNQRANRRRPRGVKRTLSKKDMRLYRLLQMWITSKVKGRGKRRQMMRTRRASGRISGPEEGLARAMIRVAYHNPHARKGILSLLRRTAN